MGKIGDYIKAKILKRNIKKAREPSALEKTIDELLGDELKNLTATGRNAEKLLKVKLMRQEQRKTMQQIQDLDEDDDDSDDTDDSESLEDTIGKALISKLLGSPNGQTPAQTSATFGDEVTSFAEVPRSESSNGRGDLHSLLDNLSDEQVTKLRSNFGL